MSVKKRKQARALQDLVRRIPLTNTAGLFIIVYLATNLAGMFEMSMGGSSGWWIGLLIGGLAGVFLFGALQKPVQRYESKFKARLQDVAQKMESSADDEDKSQNKLLDAFEIQYLGGHPGLRVSDKLIFGTLEVREKSLIFKNKEARIKMSLARLKRVSVELDRLMRHKKLPNVKLPPMPSLKRPLLKLSYEQIRKLQRYVVLDYMDDMGDRHLIVFYPMIGHPMLGNPLKAKAIKTAIDEPFSKYQKDKKGTKSFAKDGGTGKLSKVVPPQEPPQVVEATVPPAPPTPPAPKPAAPRPVPQGPATDLRYQVSLVGAGSSPEEQLAVAQRMAQIFSLPPEKAQAAVQRIPLVVKRNLTESQADDLYQSLSSIGARVSVEAMNPTMGASRS
ncbi:hypothetical protein D3C86_513630 [compost metagenome]